METSEFQTSNINALWLGNVYENIKNSENLVRMANEGCISLMEYASMNHEQKDILIADIQYKNLRMLHNELNLLITDLIPIKGEEFGNKFLSELFKVKEAIDNRKLFIKEIYSSTRNGIVSSRITSFFIETLRYLEEIRREILIEISDILYIKIQNKMNNTPW